MGGYKDEADTPYPKERRALVLEKMLAPSRVPILTTSRQEGISEATLYEWCYEARAQGRLAPDAGEAPAGWTARDKLIVSHGVV